MTAVGTRAKARTERVTATTEPALLGRVLLVDDADDVRRFMRVCLETSGWLVDEATDGEGAVAAFDEQRHDVVVLDHVMPPGITGLEAAATLRRQGYEGPIVLFSAFLDSSMTAELEALNVLPVSKVDHTAVLRVLEVYAHQPPA